MAKSKYDWSDHEMFCIFPNWGIHKHITLLSEFISKLSFQPGSVGTFSLVQYFSSGGV
jgi:hypothetical protein